MTKLNAAGSALVFSTYLGGTGNDYAPWGGGVVANANDDVYVTGYTQSTDYPLLDAHQTAAAGDLDVFLTKFSSGGTLRSSTYLGGAGTDVSYAAAVTWGGRILLAGSTASADFPAQSPWQSSLRGTQDGFVTLVEESTHPFADMAPAALPDATDGQPCPRSLPVTGGTSPLAFTLRAGSLPAGLALSSTGELSGTPSGTGAASFTVRIVDADGACALRRYGITVNPRPSVATTSLPAWTVGRPYSRQLAVADGTPPMTWSLGAGATLPGGATFTSGGLLSGTLQTTGTFAVEAQVTDANGATASRTLPLLVNPAPAITTASLPEWTQRRPYAQDLATTGGTAPFAWSLAAGTLPVDSAVDAATGRIDGTSALAGDYSFTVALTDAAGATAQHAYAVHLNPWPRFLAQRLPLAAQFRPYTAGPGIADGTAPFDWTINTGRIPVPFDMSTGVLSGTPQEAGRTVLGYAATDAAGATVERAFAVTAAARADLTTGRHKEKIAVALADNGADVVHHVELLAGTLLDLTLSSREKGKPLPALLLLDAQERPIDLGAWTKAKATSTSVKGFPVPETGRYFVVVRPQPGFEGDVSLSVAAHAPGRWGATGTVDPAAAPLAVAFSALPGSKLSVAVAAAKHSSAVPTIVSVKDAQGTELLVPAELRTSKRGAVLRVRTALAGGDYVATFSPGAGPAGEAAWTITAKSPRGYAFELPDLGVIQQ